MTLEEYKEQLLNLSARYALEQSILTREFCFSNNPYQEGSVFQDHMGKILVERIDVYWSNSLKRHACSYFGLELKKDGVPKKSGNKRWGYQCNEASEDKNVGKESK